MKKITNFFVLSMLFVSLPAINIFAEEEDESAEGGIEEVVVTA